MKKGKIWAIIGLIAILTIVVVIIVNNNNNNNNNVMVTLLEEDGTLINKVEVAKNTSIKEISIPIKDGYEFKYWLNDNKIIDENFIIKTDITLYCIYDIIPQVTEYVVTFNTDGGNEIKSIFVIENNSISEPASPTKEGYLFKYWELDGKQYDFNTLITKDITLKAIWEKYDNKKEKTYVVTFDTDGGTTINTQIVKENSKVTRPSFPKKSGYTFVEWQLNGKIYDFNQKVTKDITIKAIWKENEKAKKTYNVIFNTDGGNNIASQVVDENGVVIRPNNPTKSGYKFVEWQLNGKVYDFDSKVTNDITLKALWKQNEIVNNSYTVTFDTDGGSSITSQLVSENGKVNKPVNPTKLGYIFIEWQLNGTTFDFNSKITKNITLNAIWGLYGDVNNDGEVNSKDLTKVTQYIAGKANLDAVSIKKADVNLDGAVDYVDAMLIGQKSADYNINFPYTTSQKYTISYNLNGGVIEDNIKTVYVEEILSITLDKPTKTGYVFQGWTGSNGNTPQENVTIAKGTAGNLSYTANWGLYGDVNNDGEVNNKDLTKVMQYIAGKANLDAVSIKKADVNLDGAVDYVDAMLIGQKSADYNINFPYTTSQKYTISYNLNGGVIEDNIKTVYAEEILGITLDKPTRSGYIFLGWTGSNGNTPQENVTIAKGTAGNLSYTANWGLYGDVNNDGSVKNNDAIKVMQYIVGKANLDAVSIKKADVNLDGAVDYVDAMLIGQKSADYNINFPYTTSQKYTISYNLNGGVIEDNIKTVYVEEILGITLEIPKKSGYKFLGWTGSNGNVPEISVTIAKGTTGNLSYTANWGL